MRDISQRQALEAALLLAMQDPTPCEAALGRLARHFDGVLGWHLHNGERHHIFGLGGIEAQSPISRADAGWRWAAALGPAVPEWQAALLLRRLHFAPAGHRPDLMRDAVADDSVGWLREPSANAGELMPTACEVMAHGITAHGSELAEATANWRRIAGRLLNGADGDPGLQREVQGYAV